MVREKTNFGGSEHYGMELIRLDEFRLYYNTHIHPELLRMERLRRRLLTLMGLSLAVGLVLFALFVYLNVLLLTLIVSAPIVFYLIYLAWRIQRFRLTFKPRIIGLILDFMNESLNYRDLKYKSRGKIPKERFLQSQLFKTKAQYYEAEDYIQGCIGEMPFEMCELDVRELSPASNRLQDVFVGVFLYAVFAEEDTEGSVIIWPRRRKNYLTRAIKEYTWQGALNQDDEIMNPFFREYFLVYAKEETHVAGILSEPMQEALVGYIRRTGKDVYVAIEDRNIYAAVSEDKDLLEPNILTSNLSFELIREFYQDISLVFKIVEDFDQAH